MSKKTRTETVVAVFAAFLKRRLWQQAELARVAGVSTEALRTLLKELIDNGVPLTTKKEHPHIYWQMKPTWYPGGVLFMKDDVAELQRLLRRLPRGKTRERLLGIVGEHLRPATMQSPAAPIAARQLSEQEEQWLPTVEDAAAKKVPLSLRYFTASRAKPGERHASVHLVDFGKHVRFIATCHRTGRLQTFRVDSILHARLDPTQRFREASDADVEAYRSASLDGFKGEGAPVELSFFVREPESNWVANNLLEGMHAETFADGIRVKVKTSAVIQVARFVVSLGAAATPEDKVLADLVADLAQGALEQARPRQSRQSGEIPGDSEGAVQPRSDV